MSALFGYRVMFRTVSGDPSERSCSVLIERFDSAVEAEFAIAQVDSFVSDYSRVWTECIRLYVKQ